MKPADIWAKISFRLYRLFFYEHRYLTKKLKTMWTVYLHPIRSTTDLNLLAPKDCPGQNSTARVCFAIQSNANQDTAHANIMFNNSDYLFQLYFGYTLGNFMQKLINLLKCLLGFFVLYQLKYCLNVTCWQQGDNFKNN